jgi:hypothetical protein
MLFLPALLFIMLGISVVASPMIPAISQRNLPKSRGPATGRGHGLRGTINRPEDQKDGLWTAYWIDADKKANTFYMKVVGGAIKGISPMPYTEKGTDMLFVKRHWFRQTRLSSIYDVSDFPPFENMTSYM